jgi:hypothetical protein
VQNDDVKNHSSGTISIVEDECTVWYPADMDQGGRDMCSSSGPAEEMFTDIIAHNSKRSTFLLSLYASLMQPARGRVASKDQFQELTWTSAVNILNDSLFSTTFHSILVAALLLESTAQCILLITIIILS